jgi:hypothetical protein
MLYQRCFSSFLCNKSLVRQSNVEIEGNWMGHTNLCCANDVNLLMVSNGIKERAKSLLVAGKEVGVWEHFSFLGRTKFTLQGDANVMQAIPNKTFYLSKNKVHLYQKIKKKSSLILSVGKCPLGYLPSLTTECRPERFLSTRSVSHGDTWPDEVLFVSRKLTSGVLGAVRFRIFCLLIYLNTWR